MNSTSCLTAGRVTCSVRGSCCRNKRDRRQQRTPGET